MPAANPTFVQLCRTANIAPVPPNQRLQFLRDSAVTSIDGLSAKQLAERCAALSWARDSLQNSVDPDTWPTLLTPALDAYLHGLYVLPPHKGAQPAPSLPRRLADIIAQYTPDDGAVIPQHIPSDGIDTGRPDGHDSAQPQAPPQPPPSPSTGATSGGAPSTPTHSGKRKWLMHDELLAKLPLDVYQALDMASGMSYKSRIKLQASCKQGDMANILDRTTAAAFSHQTLLALADGAHFDPLKRGLALAGAGRSAAASGASGHSLSDEVTRDAHLRTLRENWTDALLAFPSDVELSGSHVNNLWAGVTFIMTVRASRSSTWGVPEVEEACAQQLASLPSYRSGVASVIARVAKAYTGLEIPRAVNRAYLQFFLPFWWEHILERGRLDDSAAEKQATLLLAPRPTPAPAAAPAVPALLPPVPPWPFHPPAAYPYPAPGPPPPYFQPGPPPAAPPVQAPTPYQTPRQQTPRAAPGTPYIGKPLAPVVIGNNFGVEPPAGSRPCFCVIARRFTGRVHRVFECPIRYHFVCGSCPGWTATGDRIPSSWNGDDITPACQAEWKTFASSLPAARSANGQEAQF